MMTWLWRLNVARLCGFRAVAPLECAEPASQKCNWCWVKCGYSFPSFFPLGCFPTAYLGPPEVNITSCQNCINVTIKLPTTHFRKRGKLQSLIDIYEELNYDITLKSQDGEHKVGKFGGELCFRGGHEMALMVNRFPKTNT